LWKKVARGLSAGRVQSVAVRLVVERERERTAFKTQEYWSIKGMFEDKGITIPSELYSIDDKKLDKFDIANQAQADGIVEAIQKESYTISSITKKETKRTPPAPFTTSTMQQQASHKLGYSAKQTMRLAQQLYEGMKVGDEGEVGLITYMRTDSLNLADKFLTETKEMVAKHFGTEYTLDAPRKFKNASKGAQEAHEAIRPTDPNRTPDSIRAYLSPQQHKLYQLIYNRAVATQMTEARLNKTTIDISGTHHTFRASGQTMIFPGWLALYPQEIKEEILPELNEKDPLKLESVLPEQHFTEPPARYSDATLVKALEEYGIGRPSTYAPTIGTIEARGYVERDEAKRLKPNDIAFLVNDLLVEHFPEIVDYKFTAQMEENLDEIAEGTKDWQPIIATFYHPFHDLITKKTDELTKEDTVKLHLIGTDPKSQKPIYGRIGRFGAYVQKGEAESEEKPLFASLRPGQTLQEITLDDAIKLFDLPRTLGVDAEGNEIIANVGRFGPYVKHGSKFISIKDKDPYTITLEEANEVIAAKKKADDEKTIKVFEGSTVQVLNGRYGPYITDTATKTNAKIPKDTDPKNLTLEECQKLLIEAPSKPRRGGFKKRVKKTVT
jgi:DNA topoisomerase-1